MAAERFVPPLANFENAEEVEVPVRTVHSLQRKREEMRTEGCAAHLS
jgi:hypothetical protein